MINGRKVTCILLAAIALAAPSNLRAEDGVTPTTIKIGMFGPLTGPASLWGYPTQAGAIMIYKEINDKGGIHGRKIEVVQEDGACDAAKTIAAVKKLIHREKVFMINAGICSGATMAAKDEIVANKVPHMLFAASLDAITAPANRYVFTVAPTGSFDGKSMADFAKSIPGTKKVALIGHADEWAQSKIKPFLAVMKDAGIEVVANETIDRKIVDATAQVLSVKRHSPDVVAMFTYPAESAAIVRDAFKYGLKVNFIGNNGLIDLPALAERAGSLEAAQTTYAMSAIVGAVGSPQLAPYENLLRQYFPNEKVKADNFYGTASAITIVEALKRAGPDLTREKFVDALNQMRDFDPGIAPCKVNFSPDNHQGCQSQTAWKLVGDKVVTVGPVWREVE